MAALIAGLLLGEGLARIVLDPVDYLGPKLIPDDIIRWRIEPHSGGHDAWGYRNKTVPEKADIVILGDSQTYGANVRSSHTWPAILQRFTNQTVYNTGLGGYGPVQYYYLLENKAFLLEPSIVIAGFYYGNDLEDAFHMAHSYTHWNYLLEPQFQGEMDSLLSNGDTEIETDIDLFMGSFRSWLAGNSILYRLTRHWLLENFRHFYREIKSLVGEGDDFTVLSDKNLHIQMAFVPEWQLQFLNLDNPVIKEGLRISLNLFKAMNETCSDRGITFIVLLLPTKESVYAPMIQSSGALKDSRAIHELIRYEHEVNSIAKNYFTEHNIHFVEVLDALQAATKHRQVYPSTADTHPNKHGHECIAKSINEYLKAEGVINPSSMLSIDN